MSDLSRLRLGRAYLETYYPSTFDEGDFLIALREIARAFAETGGPVDVAALTEEHSLSPEVIENAALLNFLSLVSSAALMEMSGSIRVLDVGGGPTVYQHLALSLVARHIIHAEPLPQNRAEVERYLAQDAAAYDWRAYYRVLQVFLRENAVYQAILAQAETSGKEGKVRTIREMLAASDTTHWEERVRSVVGPVVACDAFTPTLELESGTALSEALRSVSETGQVEIVTSNFVLESATALRAEWEAGLSAIQAKIIPGGFLSMTAIRNATWYMSGDEKVPATPVNEEIIADTLSTMGFTVQIMQVLVGSDRVMHGYDGMVFVLAQKNLS